MTYAAIRPTTNHWSLTACNSSSARTILSAPSAWSYCKASSPLFIV